MEPIRKGPCLPDPVFEDFLIALSHREPKRVPVVLWYTRSALGLRGGATTLLDYYKKPDLKLASQLYPLERFPEALVFPGIYPDYGVVLEASAFGCPVRFFDENPPHSLSVLHQIEDVKRLKPIDPCQDGLMPQALKEYAYMLKRLDRKHVARFPYLDGCAWVMGPLEVAAFVLGPERLFVSFYDHPSLVHRLLEIVTESLVIWLKALEKVCGELKLICMVEHTPGQISAAHCEEYFYPYCAEIFSHFPSAIKLYHNEDNLRHTMTQLSRLGIQIWHCGPWDIREIKESIGRDLVIMGNIHPIKILYEGSPEDVNEACRSALEIASEGGGYLLSSGGGLAPGTPIQNIEALIRSAALFTLKGTDAMKRDLL